MGFPFRCDFLVVGNIVTITLYSHDLKCENICISLIITLLTLAIEHGGKPVCKKPHVKDNLVISSEISFSSQKEALDYIAFIKNRLI